jgi:inward rectifier potassium channel
MAAPLTETNQTNPNEDLGLGDRVIQENKSRFLNADGSFNVHRKGVFERGAFSPYHAMLNMTWTRFYANVLWIYLVANLIFSGLYFALGPHAFTPLLPSAPGRFGELFFYSIQIITTLGSSAFQPVTVLAKTVFALEAMTGMLGFAVAAGFMFARFSNPAVRIAFSKNAIVAPFKDGVAFMFRIINGRSNELVDATAVVTLSMLGKDGRRTFHQLALERSNVLVFPLHWTVVHPITKESPLYGMRAEDFAQAHAEFLITITAVDQDLAKKVYARHSYLYDEVVVGARFTNIIERAGDGTVFVDPHRIHEIEKADLQLHG